MNVTRREKKGTLLLKTLGCMRDRSGPESSRELVGTSKKFKFSEVGRDATNCKPGFGVCATGLLTVGKEAKKTVKN